MVEPIKPEDKLRSVRLQAKNFFEQFDNRERSLIPAQTPAESASQAISAEQLNLFLRSLNLHLRSAISEVQESSRDLAELAAEVRRAETRLGQRN